MFSATLRRTPIGAILFVTLIDSGLTLPEFIREVGYLHVYKGIRTFHSFVNFGIGNALLLYRLQRSRFALPAEVLLDALTSTELQIQTERAEDRARMDDEQERAFCPAIYPVAALDPGAQITRFPVGNDFDIYATPLPDSIRLWPPGSEHEHIRETIQENYRMNNGSVFLFGPIVSYLYWRRWDEAPIVFSPQGVEIVTAKQRRYALTELRIRDSHQKKMLLSQLHYFYDIAVIH